MIEIRPEPAPVERQAILIALAQILRPAVPAQPAVSRWGMAGRREAVGRLAARDRGWDRDGDRVVAGSSVLE